MAKHKALKDAIREKELRQRLMDMLKEHYDRGLLVGSRAMLKTIRDELMKEPEKPAGERIDTVVKIIDSMLGMTDKTAREEAAKNIEDIGKSVDALTVVSEDSDETPEEAE